MFCGDIYGKRANTTSSHQRQSSSITTPSRPLLFAVYQRSLASIVTSNRFSSFFCRILESFCLRTKSLSCHNVCLLTRFKTLSTVTLVTE